MDVVGHVGEAKRLEPPRGPWAEVSGRVPAVDDDGAIAIQDGLGLLLEASKREVDRSRQVVLQVLGGRKHLDELSSLGDEAPDFLSVDFTRHGAPPLESTTSTHRSPGPPNANEECRRADDPARSRRVDRSTMTR